MVKSTVRVRAHSIKLLDVVRVDTITDSQVSDLESQGLCLWLQPNSQALVIPVGAHDKLCDLLAEAQQ